MRAGRVFSDEQREAAFLAKTLVDPATDCWLWTGARMKNGYGRFGFGRRGNVGFAHRWAYTHWNGEIPEGLDVDHDCHNRDRDCPGGWDCAHRRCVNPDHLTVATRSQNLRSSGRTGGDRYASR